MASSRLSPYSTESIERYRQGDILRDITIIEWAEIVDGEMARTERHLPYCVVLSQECDLEQDFNSRNNAQRANNDKFLQSLLLCPAFPALQFKLGTHLENVGLKMQVFGTPEFKRIVQNNNYRYHHLPEYEDFQVPALVLDFKQYITIPHSVAYRPAVKSSVLASLDDLFREHLSSRFAHYLSRVGLPDIETLES